LVVFAERCDNISKNGEKFKGRPGRAARLDSILAPAGFLRTDIDLPRLSLTFKTEKG